MDLQILIWLLPVALALHEAEEWNILAWYKRNFVDLPAERTNTTIRFFLVFLSLVGFIWTGIAVSWGDSATAAWILAPLIALLIQNILQHIYWQAIFRQYAPGIVTCILFLGPLCYYFMRASIVNGYVPVWYAVVLGAVIVPGLVHTVKARNRLTHAIYAIHGFSLFMVKRLGIANNK